jgi:curli biogenesis system outer membrane secretion channel CsgG
LTVLALFAGLALVGAGCVVNPAAMQQMAAASQPHSISPNFDLARTWRIAVLPPTASADIPMGNLYDAAQLALMRTGKAVLVDRAEVERLLQEQEFSYSGLVDPSTAARLGKLLGAEAVMLVNVTRVKHDDFFSDNPEQRDAELFTKIIAVQTAEVLYYAQGAASSFEGPEEAMSGAVNMALAPLTRAGGNR